MKENFFEEQDISQLEVEKQRELVSLIESLPTQDELRVDLILAWKGLKLATEVGIFPADDKENSREELKARAEDLFKKMGLRFSMLEDGLHHDITHMKDGAIRYAVSKYQEKLDELKELLKDPIHHQKELGIIYGFPATAVEAFAEKKKGIFFKDLPEEIKNQDFAAFHGFRLSKDHWREELETNKKWAEVIKEIAPDLYYKLVSEYQARRK